MPVIEMDSESITVSVEGGDEAILEGVTATDKKDGDITETQSKIQPTIMDIFAKRQYIKACNKLARYPSLFDYYAFLADKRIPLSDKRAVIIIADSFLCLLYKSLKRSKKAAIIRIKSFLSGLHKRWSL